MSFTDIHNLIEESKKKGVEGEPSISRSILTKDITSEEVIRERKITDEELVDISLKDIKQVLTHIPDKPDTTEIGDYLKQNKIEINGPEFPLNDEEIAYFTNGSIKNSKTWISNFYERILKKAGYYLHSVKHKIIRGKNP